ncbi:hypothetical protein M0802_002860 [Mischocyttarus mexicanus]|nr:hypothetical protein M0802_002860 [Mischocyttarus mexicanus]
MVWYGMVWGVVRNPSQSKINGFYLIGLSLNHSSINRSNMKFNIVAFLFTIIASMACLQLAIAAPEASPEALAESLSGPNPNPTANADPSAEPILGTILGLLKGLG